MGVRKVGYCMVLLVLTAFLVGVSWNISYADGKGVFASKNCGGCHQIQGPAAEKTFEDQLKKKGPELWYSGSKFKKEWLEGFLQKPTIIRPAGTVFLNNIKMGEKKDEIGEVKPCASNLSEKEAHEVTEYLMTLKEPTMKTGVIVDDKFSKAKAKVLFGQKEGCSGCHKDKADSGGTSCPTLYNAGERLNPDWVFDFLKNPQKYDPKIWMPRRELSDEDFMLLSKLIASMK